MMNSKEKLIIPSKSNPATELAGDIVFEILLRLPIKKVFQLSCVSTLWRYVILGRDFLGIYHSRNPYALVITVSEKNDDLHEINRIYHSIIEHDTQQVEFVNSLSKMNTDVVRITQSVHGLVCVCYNDSNNRRSLSLNRVRTGEIVLRLPDPGKHRLARYFLGFEPVNGVYKLLKISKPIEYFFSKTIDSNCYDFEILTISREISDMCWINLPKSSAPVVFGSGNFHPFLDKQSFSVNGFLFWMLDEILFPLLISFDLREYKFRSFKPPSNIHNPFKSRWLARFRGKLALFKPEFGCLLPKIYTLDNYDKQGVDSCWTSHVITFTSEVQQIFQSVKYSCKLIPVCNLPTGEILLAHVGTDDPFTPIYSYDYRNSGSLKKFVEGKFPDWAHSFTPHIHFDVDVDVDVDDAFANSFPPDIRFDLDDGFAKSFPPHIRFDVDDGFCWI